MDELRGSKRVAYGIILGVLFLWAIVGMAFVMNAKVEEQPILPNYEEHPYVMISERMDIITFYSERGTFLQRSFVNKEFKPEKGVTCDIAISYTDNDTLYYAEQLFVQDVVDRSQQIVVIAMRGFLFHDGKFQFDHEKTLGRGLLQCF